MPHVIEDDSYRETREKLKTDVIIQGMAAEMLNQMQKEGMDAKAMLADLTHGDPDYSPNSDFMMLALREYKRRGGTIATHIGGPAEAILTIIKGE